MTIMGTVKNGKIEPDRPVDLPEGTRVRIIEELDSIPDDWPDTPENRAEILRRMDAFEPMGWTPEEEARIRAAWEESKRFDIEAVRKQMGLDQ
jgi:hypothetical protein